MPKKTIGLYPGSFDPVTYGHLDIAKRALTMCDELHLAVVANPSKRGTLPFEERLRLLKASTRGWKGVKVSSFDGLLVDYAREMKAKLIFRGLRAVADFEYEFQMALINRTLHPGIEVVFLVPSEKYIFLSSSSIKEVAKLKGSVKGFVPPSVEKALKGFF